MVDYVYCKDTNKFYPLVPFNIEKIDNDLYVIVGYTGNHTDLTEEELKELRSKIISWDLLLKLIRYKFILDVKSLIIHIENIYQLQIKHRICHFFTYIPTFRCTNACIYCHAGSDKVHPEIKKFDMDTDIADAFINFIKTFPYHPGEEIRVVAEGGEPLLNWEIIEYLYFKKKELEREKKIKVDMSMMSNLVPMDEDIANFIIKYNKKYNDIGIGSSLDGPKEIHDIHRPTKSGKGTYDIVTYWLEYFKNHDVNIGVIPVLTKYTIEKCTPKELLDEYIKWNQKSFLFKFLHEIEGLDLYPDPEDAFQYYKEFLDYLLEVNKKGYKIYDRFTEALVNNIERPYRGSHMCHRRPCGAGFNMISIDYDGFIIGCDGLRRKRDINIIGHVRLDNFYSIFKKSIGRYFLKNSLESSVHCLNCGFNPFCNVCFRTIETTGSMSYLKATKTCEFLKRVYRYLFYIRYKQPSKWKAIIDICPLFKKVK